MNASSLELNNLNQDNRIIMIIGDDINKTNNKIKSK